MNPLFSIVTVCYNSQNTIERTLKSVLEQKFVDYEYIVVDGNSTDGTVDLIKKYEPLFEGRMKWSSEPDDGIYNAFNKGIKKSKGFYVWLVNSDDYIESDALNQLADIVRTLKSRELPIIAGRMNFRNVNDDIVKIMGSSKENFRIAYKKYWMGFPHPATVVPKMIYEKYGYYNEKFAIMADLDWFRRMYEAKVNVLFIDVILTNMCYGGISTKINFKKNSDDRKLLYKIHCKSKLSAYWQYCVWLFFFVKINLKPYVKKIFK